MRLYLSLILLSLNLLLFSGDKNFVKYRCPLDIKNGYSSSFQEFRSNHFHSGMDFRTFQKTGYPVYAISDGYIYKMRMVKRGSGRGLYLKHNDGNSSIYFHLERFENSLEKILKKVQNIRKKRYFGNYILKIPLKVKQGDLIAYSGETGSGFPHLHLEIRDKDYYAINPFRLVNLPLKDKNFPVLKSIILRNRDDSLINGEIGETFINFEKVNNSLYVLEKPIVIDGVFDIVLKTYDIADTGKIVVPYKISVFIDNKHYFNLSLNRFKRDDNNQLGFVYDMFYSNSGSYFFNLFSQKGYELEEKKIPLNTIYKSIEYGKHKLKILVYDNYNNTSTGLITFYKVRKPAINISDINVIKNKIDFSIEKLNAGLSDKIEIIIYNNNDDKLYYGKLNYSNISEKKKFVLNGVFNDVSFLDFNFIKYGIIYFNKRFLLKEIGIDDINDIEFETYINRDEVFIKVKNFNLRSESLVLELIHGHEKKLIEPEFSTSQIYFRFKPLNSAHDVFLNFFILNNGIRVKEIKRELKLILLKPEEIKTYFNFGEFEAEFHTNAVYESKVMNIEEKEFDSKYPVLSKQISLYPYNFPFLDLVYYKFKKNTLNPKQVGIFRYNLFKKKWTYVYTTYNNINKTFATRVISSGIFALMRDIYSPEIFFIRPESRYLEKLKRLVIKITDKGKGVDDNSLKLFLNGKKNDCEYDPDRNWIKVEDLRYLKRGKNLIEVFIQDYAGNRSSRTFTFFLK